MYALPLIAQAGYRRDEPLIIGLRRAATTPVFVTQGTVATGEPISETTITYIASLSKQMTAACAALLVRSGALDMESMLSEWLPELPSWADRVRLRHLVHHIAGLPLDADIDAEVSTVSGAGADRTTERVIEALSRFPALATDPGSADAYSNAGYVCLGLVVARAADEPLPDFAHRTVFDRFGMTDTRYWAGPAVTPPAAAPLTPAHPAPLSLGDGGVWSTAADLLRWTQCLDADHLGISDLLHTPGRLDDGMPLDYAWGMGVRRHAGYQVLRHGGGWSGLRAMLVQVPALGLGVVTVALADDTERRVPLVNGLLDLLACPPPSR